MSVDQSVGQPINQTYLDSKRLFVEVIALLKIGLLGGVAPGPLPLELVLWLLTVLSAFLSTLFLHA